MPSRVLLIGDPAYPALMGLPELESGVEYVVADTVEGVRAEIAGCDVVFHHGPPRDALRACWELAAPLRWVHVAGVGVDWALFEALVESDVIVTNSHGVFDTSLPEYLLALMLASAKDLRGTLSAQRQHEWRHRFVEPLHGRRAVVVGAGSIGRATGRLLRAVGMSVVIVGRRHRDRRGDEGVIHGVDELPALLPTADWLIVLVPLTTDTRGLIGAQELALLPSGAHVANIGRGPTVDEPALVAALRAGHLGGAVLDVFASEPLPADSPLWDMPNVIVSPHIGGDELDTPAAFGRVFRANLAHYLAGEPLDHVVDKRLGFVTPPD
jgi:phosphoglycerate dehydrogenase-like enzyme